MKYYRVLPKFDGVHVLKMKRNGLTIDRELVRNELYTEAEFKKLLNGADLRGRGVRDGVQIFEAVDVPKTETFWMFGARFAIGCGYTA